MTEGERDAEIAVVGGGLAGAAIATRLARAGHDVALFERLPAPRWRACGVYSSPATYRGLRDLGLGEEALREMATPIEAMSVETVGGASMRLPYGPPDYAVGLDRVRLERAMLDRALQAGARIHEGAGVRTVDRLDPAPHLGRCVRLAVATADGTRTWAARLVVGADGPRSIVARSCGVAREVPFLRRAGVTVHRSESAQQRPEGPATARMILGHDWYCGIAPVPRGRVNVGIVLGVRRLRRELAGPEGARGFADRTLRLVPGESEGWRDGAFTDEVRVAVPLAHRPTRVSGDDFLLVGDAAGFLDPLSGDGIHRALVSAELAADAIEKWSSAGVGPAARSALLDYDRRFRARFRSKDALSVLLQLFLARPRLVEHAVGRLAARPHLARTFGDVLADLQPATRALDSRFLARVLLP